MRFSLKQTQAIILAGIATSLIVFAPRLWDPSVFPKFIAATLIVLLLLPQTIQELIKLSHDHREIYFVSVAATVLFILGIFSALFSNRIFTALFGVSSRYNGLLGFHICLFFVFIGLTSYSADFIKRFHIVLAAVTTFELVLGIFQKYGFVLYQAKNPYSPIVGTFGNPNFFSAFLGFGTVSCIYLLVTTKNALMKLTISVQILVLILVLLWSQSIQGVFMIGISVFFLLTKFLFTKISRALVTLWIVISGIGAVVVALGLANLGPLARLLFQESTLFRLDYWRIAAKMILDRPLLGVGPDQFQAGYIALRDASTVRRETDIAADSAHNMYLQLGATYGVIYMSIFIAIILYILYRALREKSLDSQGRFNLNSLSISAMWIGFLLQASIALDTVSSLVPGFLLGGLVIGRFFKEQHSPLTRKVGKESSTDRRFRKIILIPVSILISTLAIVPQFNQLLFISKVRDSFSAPGSQLNAKDIKHEMRLSTFLGFGDPYLWSRITAYRYGAGDLSTTKYLLDDLITKFPDYPTFYDYQAQYWANQNDFAKALTYRKQLLDIDKVNVINIGEILTLTKKMNRRDLFDYYLTIGKSINSNFFANVEQSW